MSLGSVFANRDQYCLLQTSTRFNLTGEELPAAVLGGSVVVVVVVVVGVVVVVVVGGLVVVVVLVLSELPLAKAVEAIT
jgi:hypothetical protein